MPDRLIITALTVICHLGVTDEEQAREQAAWIDLELAIDAARAAARDDVQDAVDYGRLIGAVRGLVEHTPYHLLETMAEAVASLILKEFSTPSVLVRIKKRALPGIDYAAVEITRQREGR